jgi:hypothetical protein
MGANKNFSRELDLCPKFDQARLSFNSAKTIWLIEKLFVLRTGLGNPIAVKTLINANKVTCKTSVNNIRQIKQLTVSHTFHQITCVYDQEATMRTH